MLKSLIKIRFQGIFMRSMKGSKNKNAGIGKLALMVLVFAYIAIVFGSMFGYMFNMVLEPFTAIGTLLYWECFYNPTRNLWC